MSGPSYDVYISQLVCFARICNNVSDFGTDIIRYQSRDVIYPVLKGSGFLKRSGVSRTVYQNDCPLKRDI